MAKDLTVDSVRHSRYNPDSASSRRIAKRTADRMTPAMKQRRDLYIEGLLMGYTRFTAAIHAGIPKRSAAKEGSQMFHEPYVQQKFRELREACEEEQLVTRKEVILGLKQEATNHDDPESKHASRVTAWCNLAKICGFSKPEEHKVEILHKGGVMVVPAHDSVDAWEASVVATQDALSKDVR